MLNRVTPSLDCPLLLSLSTLLSSTGESNGVWDDDLSDTLDHELDLMTTDNDASSINTQILLDTAAVGDIDNDSSIDDHKLEEMLTIFNKLMTSYCLQNATANLPCSIPVRHESKVVVPIQRGSK